MSKTSFVRQMRHSLTDDLTAPGAFWTPADSSLHPQTHIHPRMSSLIPIMLCSAPLSSARLLACHRPTQVCVFLPLSFICLSSWLSVTVDIFTHPSIVSSRGHWKHQQVEIRRAVTEPPREALPEWKSDNGAQGGVSIWTSLSKPLSCAVNHSAVGQG